MIGLGVDADHCVVMGVLNVTPDSFSDGGRYLDVGSALAAGVQMRGDGADLVDVGGESTRPGAARIGLAEELRRVVPVVSGLCERGVPVSIDTTRAAVARAAVAAGAEMVNDVSGGLSDPAMLDTVAELGVPVVLMHWRAPSDRMQDFTDYRRVADEVPAALAARLEAAVAAGVPRDRIVLDPGLGFAKESHHNWELLAGLGQLQALGQPVLVGASRKRFLGALLADSAGRPRPETERDGATAAISALVAAAGVWGVRVHDVSSSRDAVLVGREFRKAER